MDKESVRALVEQEVAAISDSAIRNLFEQLRVEPYLIRRNWDYGTDNEKYDSWTVWEHQPSNTGIAYCDVGFGPSYPWGLVFLSGPHMSIGMDSSWFASLEDAVRGSMAWDGPNPDGYEVA